MEPTVEAKERKIAAHLARTKMAELERKHLQWNEAEGTAQNRARNEED